MRNEEILARLMERSEVFWSYTRPEGSCQLWTRASNKYGYGVFNMWFPQYNKGKQLLAHRASLMLKEERNLLPGENSCHTCDNPLCVAHAHLFPGTQAVNLADMTAKGRRRRSLNDMQLTIVRARLLRGDSYYSIAKDFNIGSATVKRIHEGKYYAN